jgi:A/G-specific adenine glycosylase
LWSFAETLVPKRSPGQFNQALMELGATVCTPDKPACDRCPVRRCCAAFADGAQGAIPQSARRPTITAVTEIAVVVERKGKCLLLKRPAGERWGGLWDFVRFPVEEERTPRQREEGKRRKSSSKVRTHTNGRTIGASLARRVAETTGVETEVGDLLTELRHGVTRFRITLRCYRARWIAGEPDASGIEHRWVAPHQLHDLPLSMTGRKLARLIQQSPSPAAE